MNVYDFDNTIYDGESVVDFYFFVLKKCPKLISVMPKMLIMLARYKACKISEDELFASASIYAKKLLNMVDFENLIPEFWDKNLKKIKGFYLHQKKDDDIIISASWKLLIDEACRRLNIKQVIASEIDIETGKVLQLCFHERKVKLFCENLKNAEIDEFYTDSLNDKPMFGLSKRVFIVKGNRVKELVK